MNLEVSVEVFPTLDDLLCFGSYIDILFVSRIDITVKVKAILKVEIEIKKGYDTVY